MSVCLNLVLATGKSRYSRNGVRLHLHLADLPHPLQSGAVVHMSNHLVKTTAYPLLQLIYRPLDYFISKMITIIAS